MKQSFFFTADIVGLELCVRTAQIMWRFSNILHVTLLIQLSGIVHSHNATYPVCAEPSFTKSGDLDIVKILYECQDNIPGSNSPPSFFPSYNGSYDPVEVYTGLMINNFIGVDDLKATISMDFYWRLKWVDPRLNMPDIWQYMNPEMELEGLEITNYIRDIRTPLLYWLPDIAFYQSIDIQVIAELIKLYSDGTVYWSRHVVVTFVEPAISFQRYPLDKQNFSIVMQSYAFDVKFLNLLQYPSPVIFNGDTQEGLNYVQENQLWSYSDYSCYTVVEVLGSPLNPNRSYATTYLNLAFERQSLGILYRLALPITIFMSVVGLSFLGSVEQRLEVTLEILLVTAALYIVIGQAIPFVGYLTLMDEFIIVVFASLSFAIGVHFATLLLDNSAASLPMNYFFSALVEFMFRLVWIPLTLVIFVRIFDIHLQPVLITLYVVCVLSFLFSMKRVKSLRRALYYSVLQVFVKKERIERHKAKREYKKVEKTDTKSNGADLSSADVDKYDLAIRKKESLKLQAKDALTGDDDGDIELNVPSPKEPRLSKNLLGNDLAYDSGSEAASDVDSVCSSRFSDLVEVSSKYSMRRKVKHQKRRLKALSEMRQSYEYHSSAFHHGGGGGTDPDHGRSRAAHKLIKSLTLTWFESFVIRLCEYFFNIKSLDEIDFQIEAEDEIILQKKR